LDRIPVPAAAAKYGENSFEKIIGEAAFNLVRGSEAPLGDC
jgi:hypothetical protein